MFTVFFPFNIAFGDNGYKSNAFIEYGVLDACYFCWNTVDFGYLLFQPETGLHT